MTQPINHVLYDGDVNYVLLLPHCQNTKTATLWQTFVPLRTVLILMERWDVKWGYALIIQSINYVILRYISPPWYILTTWTIGFTN